MAEHEQGRDEMTTATAGATAATTQVVRSPRVQRFLEWGGIAAGIVLILFGIASIGLSVNGRSTVHTELAEQQIVGSPDMTKDAIANEAKAAGLPSSIKLPTCDVAGEKIDTGSKARCFASYMKIHAYEATGGVPYSQLPRYATADGKGTNDVTKALMQDGKPVENASRNIWINETALSTALNTSYMAEQLAMFGVVVGVALLLSGVGFIILALAALRPRQAATS
jgi:hypothetical protein